MSQRDAITTACRMAAAIITGWVGDDDSMTPISLTLRRMSQQQQDRWRVFITTCAISTIDDLPPLVFLYDHVLRDGPVVRRIQDIDTATIATSDYSGQTATTFTTLDAVPHSWPRREDDDVVVTIPLV